MVSDGNWLSGWPRATGKDTSPTAEGSLVDHVMIARRRHRRDSCSHSACGRRLRGRSDAHEEQTNHERRKRTENLPMRFLGFFMPCILPYPPRER